jgi:hypothetical protein
VKKKEMQKLMEDGTPVAIGRAFSGEDVPRSVRKARIVSLGAKRAVHNGGRSMGFHSVSDGVRVEYVDGKEPPGMDRPVLAVGALRNTYEEDTDQRVVPPRDVYAEWSAWESAAAKDHERRELQQRTHDECREMALSLADEISIGLGGNLSRGAGAARAHYRRLPSGAGEYDGVVLSLEAARETAALIASRRQLARTIRGDIDELTAMLPTARRDRSKIEGRIASCEHVLGLIGSTP